MTDTRVHDRMKDQRGISVIEALVALGVFGIAAAGTGSFLVSQIRHASSSHLYTVAYDLAVEELEQARAEMVADMVPVAREVSQGGVTFAVRTHIDDTQEPGLKQITAEIRWNEPGGQRMVSIPTLYTEVRRF